MASQNSDYSAFLWTPQPKAAATVARLLEQAVDGHSWMRNFSDRLLNETGTRLIDWLDHIVAPSATELAEVQFIEVLGGWWEHRDGLFPKILVDTGVPQPILGIKVDNVEAFLGAMQLRTDAEIRSAVDGSWRIARVRHGDCVFRVVERHGYQGFALDRANDGQDVSGAPSAEQLIANLDTFRGRCRDYASPEQAFQDADARFSAAELELGRNRACDLFFESEREFWQARNQAARVQRARQDALGLGWANHDHHTYRCSRQWFAPLVGFLERMGFVCRERFFAGREAGWGAQVLEHLDCGIVIFADVDMTEEEVHGDFAHHGLEPSTDLGTVGLWCQLHGDSFVAAGMHHLECQFSFDAARSQLADAGIDSMEPFTDFAYLRQAFTRGERWPVERQRLDDLVQRELITAEEASSFADQGVIGSHLEILERNDGYKGFNQTGISKIIRETNPKFSVG